ncbi:hypothetical protein GTZ78_27765, partial [Streptomyces sp. SID8361]
MSTPSAGGGRGAVPALFSDLWQRDGVTDEGQGLSEGRGVADEGQG